MSRETRFPAAGSGHRRRPSSPARAAVRVVAPVLGAGAALALALTLLPSLSADDGAAARCPDGLRSVTVAAAPEISAVLAAATAGGPESVLGTDADCVRVMVSARGPADVAAALQAGRAAEADVWIPDSSLWLRQLEGDGHLDRTDSAAIARSPVVLALTAATATELGWPDRSLDMVDLIGGKATPRLVLPDPFRSAPASTTLLALRDAVPAGPSSRADVAEAFRAVATIPQQEPDAVLGELERDARATVPVTEQAIVTRGARTGTVPVVAVYSSAGTAMDYPYVVLADDAATAATAAALRDALSGPAWDARVQAAGFRNAEGAADSALGEATGLDAALVDAALVDPALVDPARATATASDAESVRDALRVFDLVRRGTRMLAVIDISGSMARQVPGADGATRMELAREAAANGLGVYPDQARIGLWVFSTGLTKSADHRELAPIAPLGAHGDGVPGREKLARALAEVEYIPDGDTGLYDTTLAAVRAVRQGWDAQSINSVVLLTDGRNEDENGISLRHLLSRLRSEAGNRPVPVIAVAYGRESDVRALRQITDATGGTTYEVDDARRIHEVLADAMAQRPCRPRC